jgi:uncharacterized protein (DUF488 family)
MSAKNSEKDQFIFTIGHSNHSLEHFIDLLKEHHIEVLADVRSSPYSKYTPHFDYRSLKKSMPSVGMKYIFLGEELGGIPAEKEFYDKQGYVLYKKIAESERFLEGISRLENEIKKHRVVIMCSEEDPWDCHRRLLVGRVLSERGVSIIHIRGDGSLKPEEELTREVEDKRQQDGQLDLFGSQGDSEWKSTRSALPKKPQKSSSGR